MAIASLMPSLFFSALDEANTGSLDPEYIASGFKRLDIHCLDCEIAAFVDVMALGADGRVSRENFLHSMKMVHQEDDAHRP